MGPRSHKSEIKKPLACLDIESWRVLNRGEVVAFNLERLEKAKKSKRKGSGSMLAVRSFLRPADVYCYLKARFGPPNGLQELLLRRDDSDNWIHWDYNLKALGEDIYIVGTAREVHFMISERLSDKDWRDLILKMKSDYARVGKEKKLVLAKLEKWLIFPNKYVALANVCADLYGSIQEAIGDKQIYKPSVRTRAAFQQAHKTLKAITSRATMLHGNGVKLSLLTPVMAEAFINMLILMTCRRSIRGNARQFEAFIRSDIDAKIFDLPYKCSGFIKPIDQQSEIFKNFKRVMDKRNHSIHGNIDPIREQIETVYFEGRRPLFERSGDHVGKFMESLEKQYEPATTLRDYEDVHMFLIGLLNNIEPASRKAVRLIMEDPYPGYDVNRRKCGRLFPEHVVSGYMQGQRYDDELKVEWGELSTRKEV